MIERQDSAHLQARTAVNIFMLKTPAKTVFANRLAFNKLQNVPFHILKWPISASETGRFTLRYSLFQDAIMRTWKIKKTTAGFSCTFASMGRLRRMNCKKIQPFENFE